MSADRESSAASATGVRHIESLVATCQPGHGLPRAFYHDEALYQHELERVWRRGWIFAGHSCQIPTPGDYLTFEIGDDPLIVLRDDEGGVRAFHNICRHRGTLLCAQASGHLRALVCPYHQWTYSLRGDLLSCTGMQEEIDKRELGLHRLPVEVCQGLVFLSLADEPPPFGPARELLGPGAGPQGLERGRVAKTIDYEIAANWKLVWENNRECYHCRVNHPQYVKSNFDIHEDGGSARVQQQLAEALARSGADGPEGGLGISHRQVGLAPFPDAEHDIWYSANRTVLVEGYESESMDGRRVAPLMGDYRGPEAGVLRLRTLPNFWNHSSCDHAVTTRLAPAGLHRTKARVTWLVSEDAREGVDYDLERLLPFWQLTSEQDWELCARAQRGVHSRAYQPGPLSRSREYNLDAFLRWYLRRIG